MSAVYDPSVEGPIEAVVFSFELKSIDSGAAYLAYLTQNGRHYRTGIAVPSDREHWTRYESVPLYAECFAVMGDGPFHPDFSASGGPITFGYCTGNTSDSAFGSTVSGLDNWSVTINPAAICPADINHDGAIDLEDLAQLVANFGDNDLYAGDGSLDCDRDVDLADLALLLAVFGTTCP